MTEPNKQQEQNKEQKSLVQGWIDRSALNAIRMSEDENYRQLVSSRATNWGKHIQAESDARIARKQAPHLNIK